MNVRPACINRSTAAAAAGEKHTLFECLYKITWGARVQQQQQQRRRRQCAASRPHLRVIRKIRPRLYLRRSRRRRCCCCFMLARERERQRRRRRKITPGHGDDDGASI